MYLKLAEKKSGKLQLLFSKLSAKLRGKPWEPPLSPSPSSTSKFISSKVVLKIVLIAAVAIGWQYYSE